MFYIKFLALCLLLSSHVFAQENKWWPSKWGAEDTLGSFNMLGPELTLKATKLVKTGKTYRLGIETNNKTPAFGTRTFEVTILQPNQYGGGSYGDNKFNYFDDYMAGWMGVGSQIDGLGHAGTDGVFYNGFKGKDFGKVDGLTSMGVEDYPPIVTRGVLIDMAACMGHKIVPVTTVFNRQNIMDCEKQQGISIERGDVVLLHSGWINMLETDPDTFGEVEPGIGSDGAKYLVEKEILAVGSDSWGLEIWPGEDPKVFDPVHQMLLNQNGIYILENMDTRELAADKGYEFMFVLGPARISGAVQMIINPIAIR